MKVEDLKKGFGELTLEEKMSFLNSVGVDYHPDSCLKCREIIRTNYPFKFALKYGQKSFDKNLVVCPKCISEMLSIELYKIEFFGFIENFRKMESLSNYHVWEKPIVKKFIKAIKENNIKVDETRIICDCCDKKRNEVLLTLSDLIKKYKLVLTNLK